MTKELLYIFLGGGTGSILRFGLQQLISKRFPLEHFPWSTLTVNIIGSFLIGLFYALSIRLHFSAEYRLLLTAGLCGGFTTFSTFSNENLQLLKGGCYGSFLLYATFSIVIGIMAVAAGNWLGNK